MSDFNLDATAEKARAFGDFKRKTRLPVRASTFCQQQVQREPGIQPCGHALSPQGVCPNAGAHLS